MLVRQQEGHPACNKLIDEVLAWLPVQMTHEACNKLSDEVLACL